MLAREVASRIHLVGGPWKNEFELQQSIANCLDGHFEFAREVRLSDRDRIDFLVGGQVGIEVKVDGSYPTVARQLLRYCEHTQLESIVLVTTAGSHLRLRGMRNERKIPVLVEFVGFNGF